MEQETIMLKTKTFNLVLQLEDIALQYPDIAESWLQLRQNSQFQQKNPMENVILAQLIFLYRQNSDQTAGYKIIKHQRLVKMLTKISRQLPFFDRVEQVLIMQNHEGKAKKGPSKQQNSDQKQELRQFYAQKTQSIMEKMTNKYNSIVVLLKLRPQQITTFSLEQYIKRKSQSLKSKYQQKKYPQQYDLNAHFKAELIHLVNRVGEKVCSQLSKIFMVLVKLGEGDEMVGSFLTGRHKFFKAEALDFNKYASKRGSKFLNKWGELIDEAAKVIFQFKLQTPTVENQTRSDCFTETRLQNLELCLDWCWNDIEKVVNYLQPLYNHLIGKAMLSELKSQTSDTLSQRVSQLSLALSKFMKKEMVLAFYETLSSCVKIEDWIEIETSIGIETTEILLHQKQKESTLSRQARIDLPEEERDEDSGEREQQQFKGLETCPSDDQITTTTLNKVESRQFLSDFYHHQLATLYSFIECQKRWFFRNCKFKDVNTEERYNSSLKWILLPTEIIAQNFAQLSSSDCSTFSAYIGSLIYSFFDLKDTPKLKSFLKNQPQKKTMIEEEISDSTDLQLPQRFFLYNDLQNIAVYQNLSFQNIAHCHYYLKNIKNDSRAQFEDQTWTQYLQNQVIRLFIRHKNQPKASKTQGKPSLLHQGINLINIPVRGRYCQHLDFFDLSEIYQKIFPEPFCSPELIICPKCCLEIPFDEIIYLKQAEIVLQMIKQFYIEGERMNRCMPETVNESKMNWRNVQKGELEIEEKKTFILQDLRLIISHQSQSVKLKGKYLVKNCNSDRYGCENQIQTQLSKTAKGEVGFEQNMNKEIYQTLLNPNKKFRSTKKLEKFLKNFGRTKYKQESMDNHFFLINQNQSLLNFDQKIQNAQKTLHNRQKLYKDLEKGTISI